MTVSSMTGFARVEREALGAHWVCEARSVNGRGLDVRCRLPSRFESLEQAVRALASERFGRGSIQISVTNTAQTANISVRINREVLDQILAAIGGLQALPGIEPARLDGLLALKGVVELVEAEESEAERAAKEAALLSAIADALDRLKSARRGEGQHLSRLLNAQIDDIEALLGEGGRAADQARASVPARLRDQVEALLGAGPGLDPGRLAQEAALLATRADVTEELDRLSAHVTQARGLLVSGEPVGRKLEFLAQEFNREANTLCSKSTLIDLTNVGLSLKAVIDRFREQVQNVE